MPKDVAMLRIVRITGCCVLVVAAMASPAWAIKALVRMGPPLAEGPLRLEMKPQEEGTIRFTITRDPSAAKEPASPRLTLKRGAYLSVHSETGVVVKCPVAARENTDGHLVYQFELDQTLARTSRFTLSEIEDYRGGTGYIGGGTIYEFDLIQFIDPDAEHQEFQDTLDAAVEKAEQDLEKFLEQLRQDGRLD
jgi:hypothetical protein